MSSDGSEEYAVELVLDKRVVDGVDEFLVKWEGYPHSQNSWEPIGNLGNCNELIKKFESKKGESKKNESKKGVIEKKGDKTLPSRESKDSKSNDSSNLKEEKSLATHRRASKRLKEQNIGNNVTPVLKGKRPNREKIENNISTSSLPNFHLSENVLDKNENSSGNWRTIEALRHELLNTMPSDDKNGFALGYKAQSVDGATIKDGELCLLVSFEGHSKPQFIRASIVNVETPQLVIKYYQDRVTFD